MADPDGGSEIILGEDEMAKYPFLASSGAYLRKQGFTLEQFGSVPDLKKFLDKAYERIMTAAKGETYKSELVDDTVSSNAGALSMEIFSFILAVILLKLANQTTLVKRFALREAMSAERYLEKDLKTFDKKDIALTKKIVQDLFSVKISDTDGGFKISIQDYVKHAVNFYEREWKLINRQVDAGYVFITSHEIIRLVRRELGNYISSKILTTSTPDMMPGYEEPVSKLVEYARQAFPPTVIVSTEHPPCIKHGIGVLEKGENLPHSGRFMLATFLLGREQPIEKIAPLFKNAPDYNERITMYQLNHLSGSSGSGTTYSCPSCEKLKSQDLCFATSECDGIVNPLQFGRRRPTGA